MTFVESFGATVLATDVRTYLISQSLVTTANCFCRFWPTTPINCVMVNTTEPSPGDSPPKYPVRRMQIQILVRNTNIQTASFLSDQIHASLSRQTNFLASTQGFCRAQHGPGQWFLSEAGHPVFPLNYEYRLVQRSSG